MRKAPDFASIFAQELKNYVAFMKDSGRVFNVETTILRAFDRFVQSAGASIITEELVNHYVYSVSFLSAEQYAKRYRIVRGFNQYLCLKSAGEPIRPMEKVRNRKRHIAYIYTPEDICLILRTATTLLPQASLRPQTYFSLFGLLYTTGLRISEAIHLDNRDVDLEQGILSIRETKFRKSRIVPIHETTKSILQLYAAQRDALIPITDCDAFFLSNRKKRLNYGTVNDTFLTLTRQCGLRNVENESPRIHDLRHTFAVRRIAAWYDEGVDIQEKLPLLSTYMGHAHFEDTTYYLNAGAELLARGAKRFQMEVSDDA